MPVLSAPGSTPYDLNFKFGGFPTRIHPFFWLVALFIGWQSNNLPATAVGMLCLGISILVHEFGHAYAARHYGCRNIRILLYGFGGLAMFQGNPGPKKQIAILFAGPGAGFLLGGAALVIRMLEIDVGGPLAHLALYWLLFINLFWGLVNLVPLYPLDGGQIAMNFLGMKKGRSGEALALKISMVTGVVLGVLAFMGGLTFLAMFCGFFVWENWQLLQMGGPSGGMPTERLQSWQKKSDWWK